MAKSFDISKQLVWQAYKQVKANKGAAGIDGETIEDFERDLKGSYFPPAVRAVAIPKRSGGTRTLGIPCVSDRIAQTAVKLILEPELEPCFHPDSYGYRPGKSAIQAVAVTRERCWKRGWVFEFDIKGAFDNIDHTLLTMALISA